MSELSDDTRALLARGRDGVGLADERRAALRAGLFAKIAAGGVAVGAGAGAASSSGAGVGAGAGLAGKAAAAWAPLALKIAGAVMAVGVVSGGAVLATRHEIAQAPIVRAPAAPATLATTTTTTVAATTPIQTPIATPTAASNDAPASSGMTSSLEPRESPAPTEPVVVATNAPAGKSVAAPSNAQPKSVAVASPPSRASSASSAMSTPASAAPAATTATAAGAAAAAVAPTSAAPAAAANAPAAGAPAGEAVTEASTVPRRPPSSLEAEALALQDAHRTLVAGDPGRALRLLDDHARRFPASALEPERSADRIFAMCALGQKPAAHTAAEAFLSAHPDGPLSSRVRGSCGER